MTFRAAKKIELSVFFKKPSYGLQELLQLVPLGRTTILREVNSGRLKVCKLETSSGGNKKMVFLSPDVIDWLQGLRESSMTTKTDGSTDGSN